MAVVTVYANTRSTVAILLAAAMSIVGSFLTIDSMKITEKEEKVEFADLVQMFLRKRWHFICHLWIYLSLQSIVISSILLFSQVFIIS